MAHPKVMGGRVADYELHVHTVVLRKASVYARKRLQQEQDCNNDPVIERKQFSKKECVCV